jgi:hypothetical protein
MESAKPRYPPRSASEKPRERHRRPEKQAGHQQQEQLVLLHVAGRGAVMGA